MGRSHFPLEAELLIWRITPTRKIFFLSGAMKKAHSRYRKAYGEDLRAGDEDGEDEIENSSDDEDSDEETSRRAALGPKPPKPLLDLCSEVISNVVFSTELCGQIPPYTLPIFVEGAFPLPSNG